jgi:prepilin signal peptidase PulO-like enzyme (type II secretory pathway)
MISSHIILTSFCLALVTHYLLHIGKIYLLTPLIGHDRIKINSMVKTTYLVLLASAMFGLTLSVFGFSWHGWLAILLCSGLFILATMDWDYWLLPDQITLSLLWLGLLSNCYQGFTTSQAAVLEPVQNWRY